MFSSVEEAIKGGATVIQLREKNISTLSFHNIAKKLKEITHKYRVPLIINDRIDIALSSEADGLHIGQDDMPLEIARKIIGKDKIIGVSVRTLEQALLAENNGADYLGVGAIYPTGSKEDATLVGLEALKSIKENVKIPVVAIGGIKEDNCKEVIKAKADGIAVISAIFGEDDIRMASKKLQELILDK
ncbi:hypothetical protein M918_11435 [Clostridium sp. BL8]|nr:hypothetical protein M918_11435 [Clostridium sp. BL8]